MKKQIALLLISILSISTSYATTWETSSRGFWQDSTVWIGGVIPDTTSSDTFLIKHPIVIENDLTFESGAHILIEADGGICGHQIATVRGNAEVIVYGILELDELYVNSGIVRVFEGDLILTKYAEIKGQGGTLKVEEDASMVVGEWFECMLPDYAFVSNSTASISEEVQELSVIIYPNPFLNSISIDNLKNIPATLKVYDLTGRMVFQSSLSSKIETNYNLNFLETGIYIFTVRTQEGFTSSRILKNCNN